MVLLCEQLLEEVDSTIPVNVRALASARGALVREVEQSEAGLLYPEGDRLVISVRATDTEGRRRFTVCHEICHTFFPDFREGPRHRAEPEVGAFDVGEAVEYLCDMGAAELLLPRRSFARLLQDEFTLDDVLTLAGHFQASVTATAVRCVNLSGSPGAVVILEPDAEGALAVRSATSRGMPAIPARTHVPPESGLTEALRRNRVAYRGQTGLLPEPCMVSAIALPYERDGRTIRRVLALLRP